jgi:hypothetical protein
LIILHLRWWRYCASSCPEAEKKSLLDLTPVGAIEKVLAAVEKGKINAAAKRSKYAVGRGATSTSTTLPTAPVIAAAPAPVPDLVTYIFPTDEEYASWMRAADRVIAERQGFAQGEQTAVVTVSFPFSPA